MKPRSVLSPFAMFVHLGISGCATVHPGNVGTAVTGKRNLPLKVSAEVAEEQGGESFAVIYLTFENLGDRWVRIDETEIEIGASIADRVSVVVGKDLTDWACAVEERAKLRAQNEAVASALTHDSASKEGQVVHAVGGLAVAGALTYAVGDAISSVKSAAESPRKAPENHVCQPSAVPGRRFIRKWVLLNKPSNERITHLVFSIRTIEGEKEQYAVDV